MKYLRYIRIRVHFGNTILRRRQSLDLWLERNLSVGQDFHLLPKLIEFIIGIRGDYSKQQIVWDMNLTEANGIERYPFGPEGIISLKAEARRSVNDEPHITVDTNIGFELFVLYGEKEKKITVLPGKHTY